MIPNQQQLIGLLAHAEPGFIAGDFATRFDKAAGLEGETGSFRYFPEGFWDVTFDGGPRVLSAPWGIRFELESGAVEEAPGRGRTLPRRPPWSLVLPRHSTFLGREHDDWQMDASRQILEESGTLTVALTNLEDPSYTGTLTVDTDTYTISSVDLHYMVQILAVARTEPSAEDLAVLDDIRSRVGKPNDG
ncbi:hypothetical protein [Arthrobacter sp. NPDC057013]|uniref:hypothetical protein n=1 Tax=Arthrobacter sp. NPDC057013 TaxID=3345999 RepID=UPI003640A6F8